MTSISKRLKMDLESEYDNKDVIGFIIIYFIVVLIIPYILFHYASFTVFVTYFANVDIISNVLAVNFPDYFIKWYTVYNNTLSGYISYNTLNIIALSGIFYFGIKDFKHSKTEKFIIMIIMSIFTWTLPSLGIPFMNEKIEDFLKNNKKIKFKHYNIVRLLITICISLIFLFIEIFIIRFIKTLKL